jgi:hypothetical protein
MGKERKFKQQFYVGDVIQDCRDDGSIQWKVLSAKFIETPNEGSWVFYDQWEYSLELTGISAKLYGEHEETIHIVNVMNYYKVIQPGEARLWA